MVASVLVEVVVDWLERLYHDFDCEVVEAIVDGVGVNTFNEERPLVEQQNLVLQAGELDVTEVLAVLVNAFLREHRLYQVVTVRYHYRWDHLRYHYPHRTA